MNLQKACDLWDSEHTPGDWQKVTPLPGLPDAVAGQARA